MRKKYVKPALFLVDVGMETMLAASSGTYASAERRQSDGSGKREDGWGSLWSKL